MNKETFQKLKVEKLAKPKKVRDRFKFLREWLTSKSVAKRTLKHEIQEHAAGSKQLGGYGISTINMLKRSMGHIKGPDAKIIENRRRKEVDEMFKAQFTRKQWNQMLVYQRRQKNLEHGLNRYGAPIVNGHDNILVSNL